MDLRETIFGFHLRLFPISLSCDTSRENYLFRFHKFFFLKSLTHSGSRLIFSLVRFCIRNIVKKGRKLIIRSYKRYSMRHVVTGRWRYIFQSHLCKNNHPPKSLYGNFGTTRVICVLASPCRHSTTSVIRNSRLPHFAFRALAPKFLGFPPLAIFRLRNVSWFHSFWTPLSWPFLSRFPYPGIQPRPSALVAMLFYHVCSAKFSGSFDQLQGRGSHTQA